MEISLCKLKYQIFNILETKDQQDTGGKKNPKALILNNGNK